MHSPYVANNPGQVLFKLKAASIPLLMHLIILLWVDFFPLFHRVTHLCALYPEFNNVNMLNLCDLALEYDREVRYCHTISLGSEVSSMNFLKHHFLPVFPPTVICRWVTEWLPFTVEKE